MEYWAFLLVIPAAFTHATWNYLTKKVGGGSQFIWLVAAVSTLLYLPVAVWICGREGFQITYEQACWLSGSGLWHVLYFCLLEYCYRNGDLSLIYPLTRGMGVLLATIAAVLLLGERPAIVAIIGIVLIIAGVFALTGCKDPGGNKSKAGAKHQLMMASGCGILIAIYTLWDKVAVSSLSLNPLLISWWQNATLFVLLSIVNIHKKCAIADMWREHWREAVSVGILCPLGYIIILIALTVSPVSYIAPARELSILIGTFLGTKCLDEVNSQRRIIGAGIMVTGIFALAVG